MRGMRHEAKMASFAWFYIHVAITLQNHYPTLFGEPISHLPSISPNLFLSLAAKILPITDILPERTFLALPI